MKEHNKFFKKTIKNQSKKQTAKTMQFIEDNYYVVSDINVTLLKKLNAITDKYIKEVEKLLECKIE